MHTNVIFFYMQPQAQISPLPHTCTRVHLKSFRKLIFIRLQVIEVITSLQIRMITNRFEITNRLRMITNLQLTRTRLSAVIIPYHVLHRTLGLQICSL